MDHILQVAKENNIVVQMNEFDIDENISIHQLLSNATTASMR